VSASFHDVTPGLGIVGLGGSLSEWVLDPFAPYASRCWSRAPLRDPRCDYDKPDAKYFAPYRGGAWISAAEWLAASVRVDPFPNYFNNYQFGFRCARRGDQP
jgi:formylglycine-generating enzyme required for sulfatase activity